MGWLFTLLPSKAKLYSALLILLAVVTLGIYSKGRNDARRAQRRKEAEDYAKTRKKIDKALSDVSGLTVRERLRRSLAARRLRRANKRASK